MRCHSRSDTIDPCMDLSLYACDTLQQSLQQYTRPEPLRDENQYNCSKCGKKVDATKQMSINTAPNVLTLQIKRFNALGGKISRMVKYPETLSLKEYGAEGEYGLYAVVVHSGGSCRAGHYYAFVKAANGMWYCMDDSAVRQVSVQSVLSQQAYLIFYVRSCKSFSAENCRVKVAEKVHLNGDIDEIFQKSHKSPKKKDSFSNRKELNEILQSKKEDVTVKQEIPIRKESNQNRKIDIATREQVSRILQTDKIKTWPDIDPILAEARQKMHHSRKRHPTFYDMEYDQGRVKRKKPRKQWTTSLFQQQADKLFIHYFVPTNTYTSILHPPSLRTCLFHILKNRSLSSTPQPCVSTARRSTQRTSASATLSASSSYSPPLPK